MKSKRIIFILKSMLMVLVLAMVFSGCAFSGNLFSSDTVSVVSIEKTSTEGLVDIYTVNYSDGTTGTIRITNGKDGENAAGLVSIESVKKTASDGTVDTYTIFFTDGTSTEFEIRNGSDGRDITALSLYEAYKEIYGTDLEYAEFLSRYMTLEAKTEKESYTVINECLQSVAKVYCEFTEPQTDNWGHTTGTTKSLYTGACVVYLINEDYTYFITNYHVVYNEDATDKNISDTIHCYLYGSEGYPEQTTDSSGNTAYDYGDNAIVCEFVGGTVQYDLAIICAKTEDVKKINGAVKAVEFADDYYVGQIAVAIGNPNGEGISVTQGIVSVDNEFISLSIDGTSRYYRSIRIDTALYQGNSGGGLFNADGQLIGIANAGNMTDQNINFAVPVQIVKGVAENIMRYFKDGDDSTNGVYKITVGVTVSSQNSKYVYDVTKGYGKIEEDILIMDITSGSIAEGLGLTAGDIVTAMVVDGIRYDLNRYFDISDRIVYLKEGTGFSFVYERNEEEYTTSTYIVQSSDLAAVA